MNSRSTRCADGRRGPEGCLRRTRWYKGGGRGEEEEEEEDEGEEDDKEVGSRREGRRRRKVGLDWPPENWNRDREEGLGRDGRRREEEGGGGGRTERRDELRWEER